MLVLSPTPDALPQLTIVRANGAVKVSWPSTYSTWALYQSTSSSPTATWTQVPGTQYQTTGSTISVTISPTAGPVFFRLRKF